MIIGNPLLLGGGGGGDVFAFIIVTYPAGSVCTCTDGTKTLTAKDTTGSWVFEIPYAGTWTVSRTDGEQTASASVSINAKGQSESVELSYKLFIIRNGVMLYGDDNKFTLVAKKYNSSQSASSHVPVASYDPGVNIMQGTASTTGFAYIDHVFQKQNYSTIKATGVFDNGGTGSVGTRLALYSEIATYMSQNVLAEFSFMSQEERTTMELSLDNVTVPFYVGFMLQKTATQGSNLTFTDLWFE